LHPFDHMSASVVIMVSSACYTAFIDELKDVKVIPSHIDVP